VSTSEAADGQAAGPAPADVPGDTAPAATQAEPPSGDPPSPAGAPAGAASSSADELESARAGWRSSLLYLHVVLMSTLGGFSVLAWFLVYEALNKLIWDNGFVTAHAWMFPLICLPFSLVVGLLVKYGKAPSNLDGSILESLTGDVTHLSWRDLPATVAQSLASLFSGAVLGPEGAIGNIASKLAALYAHLFRIRKEDTPQLVFASVASGYNGLLENPVFTAVLGAEVAKDRRSGLATLPATLIGGGVGYAIFLLLHGVGLVNFLHLPPVQHVRLADALLMVPLALLGLVLAVLAAAFMRIAQSFFGRFQRRIVTRALIAGAVFSIVGAFAPIVMFSGEEQVGSVIEGAAGYGIALLLVMAVGKLALLAVGFKSGFLGGPTFPVIFASTSVALALNLAIPSEPVAILVAGIMAGAVYALFRTPLMVVLLTSFMLDAGTQVLALIVLAVATVMIVLPALERVMAGRRGRAGAEAATHGGGAAS
jgi:H+/Cl- antiporter ClcA